MMQGSSTDFVNGEESIKDKDELLKIASHMLKTSAEYIKKSDAKNAELARENIELQAKLHQIAKDKRINSVIDMMLDKGVLKTADVGSKREELNNMNEEALLQLESVVEDMPENSGDDSDEGVDSLSFLVEPTKKKSNKKVGTSTKLERHFASLN